MLFLFTFHPQSCLLFRLQLIRGHFLSLCRTIMSWGCKVFFGYYQRESCVRKASKNTARWWQLRCTKHHACFMAIPSITKTDLALHRLHCHLHIEEKCTKWKSSLTWSMGCAVNILLSSTSCQAPHSHQWQSYNARVNQISLPRLWNDYKETWKLSSHLKENKLYPPQHSSFQIAALLVIHKWSFYSQEHKLYIIRRDSSLWFV